MTCRIFEGFIRDYFDEDFFYEYEEEIIKSYPKTLRIIIRKLNEQEYLDSDIIREFNAIQTT